MFVFVVLIYFFESIRHEIQKQFKQKQQLSRTENIYKEHADCTSGGITYTSIRHVFSLGLQFNSIVQIELT